MSRTPGTDGNPLKSDGPVVPIVGLGSSAGGLEALQRFFSGLPARPGMAFVVVSHLDPIHTSSLPEILAKDAELTVLVAQNDAPLEADHVYVLPPDAGLAVRHGLLRMTSRPEGRHAWRPIDEFLISLAEDQGERALAVILSGAGADGSLGIGAIKLHGGVILAQDPQTAGYPSMPQSAIDTGAVDRVLPPEQLAALIVDYASRGAEGDVRPGSRSETARVGLRDILELLRESSQHDFTAYRPAMLRRRLARRMRLQSLSKAADYVRFVREHPEELAALGEDFLISVTAFFRDAPAWEALQRRVVTPLVSDAAPGGAVRVWVPACATGEEAYSVAMLFLEEAAAQKKQIDLRVFATDLSPRALARARNGVYPASIDLNVSPERLARFFSREDETYRVNKELRERIVVAPHNLLHDPAFSRLHLITCRNVLIYLEPAAQQRVLQLFHFALREQGSLFLGRSESAGKAEDFFQPVSRHWRLFKRTGPAGHPDPRYPTFGVGTLAPAWTPRVRRSPEASSMEARVRASLAARYAPASVAIDSRFQVLYFHGATDEFIQQPAGAPTRDLRRLLRDGLSPELTGAVHRVAREGQEVTVSGRRPPVDGQEVPVSMTVCPLPPVEGGEEALLVSFEKHPPRRPDVLPAGSPAGAEQLLAELAAIRQEHRGLVEVLESSNDELAAANEEILSNSEEFQATNEELQTSQEELQALNEELASLNQELREKVQALETTSNDLENVLLSSGIATLFLNPDFSIRWFGLTAARLLGLLSGDVGRPVSQLSHCLLGGELVVQAGQVLQSGAASEGEFQDGTGLWYLRRLTPYRTKDGNVEGVVVVFLEITARKRVETRLADDRKSE